MGDWLRNAAKLGAENQAKQAKEREEQARLAKEQEERDNAVIAQNREIPIPALPKPLHRMKAKDIEDYKAAIAKLSPFENQNSPKAKQWLQQQLDAKVPKENQEYAAESAKVRGENETFINQNKAQFGVPKAAITREAKQKVTAAYEQDKATYAAELAKQKDELARAYEQQAAEAKQAREAVAAKAKEERIGVAAKAKQEREQKLVREKQELATKHEEMNKAAIAKEKENEKILDEMHYENEHRAEINQALGKLKTGDNCTSTAVENLAMEHRDDIESEVEDDFDELDDDELEGGYQHLNSVADQIRMINERYVMNNPDGRSHITMGNASRRKKHYKGGANIQLENFNKKVAAELHKHYEGRGREGLRVFENQMRRMIYNKNPKNKLEGGVVGALVQLAKTGVKILHELYGPQIEAGLKQMVQQVANFFNDLGDKARCFFDPHWCNRKREEAERAQREAQRVQQEIENQRYAAEYEVYLTSELQNKLEDEKEKMEDQHEKEYEQLETQLAAKNNKEEEDAAAALQKEEDDAAAALQKEEEEGEALLEREKGELEGKQAKYVEGEKQKKKNFEEAVVKNVEQRVANRGKDNEVTAKLRNFKNCASNINQAEKDRHEAIEEERARREKAEEEKAKGITPSNPNGSGRKTGKNSKKISIRDALKYY